MPHVPSRLAAALSLAAALAAVAPAALAQTQPGEIKGQDVMGDKSRSATDGWVQAPIPREDSAAKDAPNPGGQSVSQNKDRPVPNAPTSYPAGQEPQQPLPHRTPGPSGQNPDAPAKK
ncbi:hypothetical protein [uncultured Methylobacterium sp.]|uniref:hypothetical protein n=1 Tax=uncultured Methylobacterium sp. TaxID=157278 RepID=UPI002622E9BF|nr:hypothetical protein [uncultured Methylobacterium sp.]